MEKVRWRKEWKRRKKDRPERPPRMQAFLEAAEKNKVKDLVLKYQRDATYNKWKALILTKILATEVKQRLGALQLVNPQLSYQIETYILDHYLKGHIQFVTFDDFKRIVGKFQNKYK